MIKDRNVFVLGAGARAPYGFPDGRILINRILGCLPEGDGHTDFMQLFYQVKGHVGSVPDGALAEFRKALMESGHTSIDSFLATRAKHPGFVAIGKAAVAYILLPLEYRHTWGRTSSPEDDWMSLLFEKMMTGCLNSPEELARSNQVAFVDFNYDRSLEDFFVHPHRSYIRPVT